MRFGKNPHKVFFMSEEKLCCVPPEGDLLCVSQIPKVHFSGLFSRLKTFCVAARCRKGRRGQSQTCRPPNWSDIQSKQMWQMNRHRGKQTNRLTEIQGSRQRYLLTITKANRCDRWTDREGKRQTGIHRHRQHCMLAKVAKEEQNISSNFSVRFAMLSCHLCHSSIKSLHCHVLQKM